MDCFLPAHFVKSSKILIVYLSEDGVGRLTMWSPDQSFKRDDFPIACIHNGLKCKTEFKAKFTTGIVRKVV